MARRVRDDTPGQLTFELATNRFDFRKLWHCVDRRRNPAQSGLNDRVTNSNRAPSELTVELFDRSAVVLDLVPAQVDAWCSGLWAAWESDAEEHEFVAYCEDQGGAVAALVCASLARLADGDIAAYARRVAEDNHAHVTAEDRAEPVSVVEAWRVEGRSSHSIVLGCGADGTSDHAVLLEFDEAGNLVDLLLGGNPHELVHGTTPVPDTETESDDSAVTTSEQEEETGLENLVVTTLTPSEAVGEAVRVWRTAADTPRAWPSTVRANEHLVRHRLGAGLPRLSYRSLDLDVQRGLDDGEFAEANAAARSTLRSALGTSIEALLIDGESSAAEAAAERAWVAVISGALEGLPIEEHEALLFLEWADWLGAGIGMARAGAGTPVDGQALVDFVNRCPEVSTTIDKRDREYVAFAFDIALELVADGGGITDGKLTEAGHRSLSAAMARAWGGGR